MFFEILKKNLEILFCCNGSLFSNNSKDAFVFSKIDKRYMSMTERSAIDALFKFLGQEDRCVVSFICNSFSISVDTIRGTTRMTCSGLMYKDKIYKLKYQYGNDNTEWVHPDKRLVLLLERLDDCEWLLQEHMKKSLTLY